MLTDGGGGGTSFEEDLDSVAPRSAPAGASEPPPPGGVGLGIRTVRLFGEAGQAPGIGGGSSGAGGGDAALDFKLAAAVLRTGGGGGASGSDEDEVSEISTCCITYRAFLVAQLVKNPPAVYGYTTLNAPDLV